MISSIYLNMSLEESLDNSHEVSSIDSYFLGDAYYDESPKNFPDVDFSKLLPDVDASKDVLFIVIVTSQFSNF